MRATGARALVLLILSLTLVGCSNVGFSPNSKVTTMTAPGIDLSTLPSMEQAIDDLEKMRAEAIRRLDTELGTQEWTVVGSDRLRKGCGAGVDPEGEKVILETLGFPATYDAARWQRSAEIVTEVATEYGFTTELLLDRPGDLLVTGTDQTGAGYTFGMAKRTTFSLTTGCHLWDTAPTPEP